MVNMFTLSALNTALIASSQRIHRLSLGSCRSCSRTYSQILLTVCGRDNLLESVKSEGSIIAKHYLKFTVEQSGQGCR